MEKKLNIIEMYISISFSSISYNNKCNEASIEPHPWVTKIFQEALDSEYFH